MRGLYLTLEWRGSAEGETVSVFLSLSLSCFLSLSFSLSLSLAFTSKQSLVFPLFLSISSIYLSVELRSAAECETVSLSLSLRNCPLCFLSIESIYLSIFLSISS